MMRGLLLLLCFLFSLNTYAFSWQDLWLTSDQQAQELMKKNQFKAAEDKFLRDDWTAAAAYRAGNYQKAVSLYQTLKDEQSYYNQGNALAHLGKYEEAIKAYDQALALNSTNQDARYNRKLVAALLKEEKKQNKDQQSKDQQSKDQQSKDQQSKDQQSKDQQSKDQQSKDQQSKDQQSKDQQNKEQQNKEQQNKEQQNKEQQNKEQQIKDQQKDEAKAEANQEKQQWLRLIPDDPGGLMREKFLRDHLRRESGWY
jgi:Ca-activated chloride channel family protein